LNRYKWLKRGVRRPYTVLAVAVELVMGSKLDLIMRNHCPYCRAHWIIKSGLVHHLGRGRCAEMLGEDIQLAIRAYNVLQSMVRKTNYAYKVCFNTQVSAEGLLQSRVCLQFKNKSSAVRFLRGMIETRQVVLPVEPPTELREILLLRRIKDAVGNAQAP